MTKFARIAALLAITIPSVAVSQGVPPTYALMGEGGSAIGTVTLTQAPRGLIVRIDASGLQPGWHGMHFHSVATCADAGFKASGGHVHDAAVTAPVHGLLNPNESDRGDLPNIYVGSDGKAHAEVFAPGLSLGPADGRLNLLDADGSAVVIHAGADDHMSQPIGGAGARIACAAIK